MTMNINFPNLGIYLENVGKSVTVFGFKIAFYGMIIGLGVLAGIMMAAILAKKTGQNPDTYPEYNDYYDYDIEGYVFAELVTEDLKETIENKAENS